MGKHLLFVYTDPVEGREDDYNTWYNEVHVGEVLQTPGIVSAQRFKVADVMPGVTEHKYVAIYEIEGDPAAAVQALNAALPGMNMSDAINVKTAKLAVVSACSDLVAST